MYAAVLTCRLKHQACGHCHFHGASGMFAPCVKMQSCAQRQQKHLQLWRHLPKWWSKSRHAASRASAHRGAHLDSAEAANELEHHRGRPHEVPAHLARKVDCSSASCALYGVQSAHHAQTAAQTSTGMWVPAQALESVTAGCGLPLVPNALQIVSAHCCKLLCEQCSVRK